MLRANEGPLVNIHITKGRILYNVSKMNWPCIMRHVWDVAVPDLASPNQLSERNSFDNQFWDWSPKNTLLLQNFMCPSGMTTERYSAQSLELGKGPRRRYSRLRTIRLIDRCTTSRWLLETVSDDPEFEFSDMSRAQVHTAYKLVAPAVQHCAWYSCDELVYNVNNNQKGMLKQPSRPMIDGDERIDSQAAYWEAKSAKKNYNRDRASSSSN